MMNYIFGFMIIISVLGCIINGNSQGVTNAFLNESVNAIELFVILLGSMAFWGGIMNIAKSSGLTDKISFLFSPIINFLFRDAKNNPKAKEAISMNISANLMGLGNAAIPLGISAMNELKKMSTDKSTASRDMVMMVVLNSASMQLIPTTVGMLRLNAGAAHPFDIMPGVWIVSLISLISGITMVKISSRQHDKKSSKS